MFLFVYVTSNKTTCSYPGITNGARSLASLTPRSHSHLKFFLLLHSVSYPIIFKPAFLIESDENISSTLFALEVQYFNLCEIFLQRNQ